MKYFLYASPSKIDMLFSQIPRGFLETLDGELKFSVLVLEGTLKQNHQDPTLYNKIQVVDKYLRKKDLLGSIDKPSDYFEGTLNLSWGEFASKLVYFAGETAKTIVGLGGSAANITGQSPQTSSPGYSDTYHLLNVLNEALQENDEFNHMEDPRAPHVLYSVEKALHVNWGVNQRLQFVAKRLMQGKQAPKSRNLLVPNEPVTCKSVLLGTPLYVRIP